MTNKSLSEIYSDLREAEFQEKLAGLQTAWEGENLDEKIELLESALEHIKEAQEAGKLPKELDSAQSLDLGVTLVEDYLASQETEKVAEDATDGADETEDAAAASTEAEAEGSEEALEDEDQIKLAQEMGAFAGAFISENGITVEDLNKIASEDDVVAMATACAEAYVAWLSSQDE